VFLLVADKPTRPSNTKVGGSVAVTDPDERLVYSIWKPEINKDSVG
jgi:hypothetical protein